MPCVLCMAFITVLGWQVDVDFEPAFDRWLPIHATSLVFMSWSC